MALILVVDDEEMERVFERTILESAGHQLIFASDGETALKICRESHLDVVITDLAMPDFNGLRFIKELREADIWVPVIAVSGWATDQLDLACEYGADIALAKPIDPRALIDAVDRAVKLPNLSDRTDPWRKVKK